MRDGLMICPNCNHEILKISEHCSYCGHGFKENEIPKLDLGGCASQLEGCGDTFFKLGCALTLFWLLLGLLLLGLGIL